MCHEHVPSAYNTIQLKRCNLVGITMQACNRYHDAWQLQNNSHAALYNWGVALSDMAHLEKRTEQDAAYHCLLAAAEKYALSLFYSANNPQVCFTRPIHVLRCATKVAPIVSALLVASMSSSISCSQ